MVFYLNQKIRKINDTYTVREGGYIYSFDQDMYNELVSYNTTNGGTVSDWYRSLSKEKQAQVKKTI